MAHPTKVITIGLSGPSSGGKTTVSRYLKTILPNSTIVHQDDFYRSEDQLPLDPKTGLANWDCPEAIDFDSLISTLTHLKEKGSFPPGFNSLEDKNPVGSSTPSTPIPDHFLDGLREVILSELPSTEVQETKFVILDGFMLFVNQELIDNIDLKFFLTAPYQILKERRESRKGYATLEGYWVDPPGYFDDVVWPNYLACNGPFVELTEAIEAGTISGIYKSNDEHERLNTMTQQVDIISSGDTSIQSMVQSVATLLAQRLQESKS